MGGLRILFKQFYAVCHELPLTNDMDLVMLGYIRAVRLNIPTDFIPLPEHLSKTSFV
jgi:hypothetical protein